MITEIKNYPNYYVDELGNIYSSNGHDLRKIKPQVDTKGNYYMIRLIKDGKQYRKLVHRLVVETFVENPCNYPEVNHINNDMKDNRADNLEWCTHKQNLLQSYETMPPKRYFKECSLYIKNNKIGDFDSCLSAAKYAYKTYGYSISSLRKYHICKDAYIKLK